MGGSTVYCQARYHPTIGRVCLAGELVATVVPIDVLIITLSP